MVQVSAEGCPADPRAAVAWIERGEAEALELAEVAAEIAVDGRPAVWARWMGRVLGEPAPPEYLELGDGTVLEVGGEGDPTGAP